MLPQNAYISHQKFPFLVSHMTCLHKHQSSCNFCFSWVTWPAYIIHQNFLFWKSHPKPFPVVAYISHQNSLFWYFHIWQVTWPLPPTRFPYPRFLPNWETLLNQATGSSPPKKAFKQSRQKSGPLWWIQQTLRSGPQNSEIFSRKYSKSNKDYWWANRFAHSPGVPMAYLW